MSRPRMQEAGKGGRGAISTSVTNALSGMNGSGLSAPPMEAAAAQFVQACAGLHVSLLFEAYRRDMPQQPRIGHQLSCLAAAAATAAAAAVRCRCLQLSPTCSPPCTGSQNAATRAQAEAALLEFRRSAGVEACVAILQQSSDEGVRFQASSSQQSSCFPGQPAACCWPGGRAIGYVLGAQAFHQRVCASRHATINAKTTRRWVCCCS